MSAVGTLVTELGTALGMLVSDRADPLGSVPRQLKYVSTSDWDQFVAAVRDEHESTLQAAFENGRYFFRAVEGLRSREPITIEWKGPHRPPGDDVAPIDLRVDRVFLVSCKYLSKVLLNAGPSRLFDRLLVGEERAVANWFAAVAPAEYAELYASIRRHVAPAIASAPGSMTAADRAVLKGALADRLLPEPCREPWAQLVSSVSHATARRWGANLGDRRSQLRLLWRMLRIGDAPYFVLGHDRQGDLRLRVSSRWDWSQDFEFVGLSVAARESGQPEVGWIAHVRRRRDQADLEIHGHVEIRWSHGRFQGAPEAKVYLDTRHIDVPGYSALI